MCAVVRTSVSLNANCGASRIGRYSTFIPSVSVCINRHVLGLGMCAIMRTSKGLCTNCRTSRLGCYLAFVPSVSILVDCHVLDVGVCTVMRTSVGFNTLFHTSGIGCNYTAIPRVSIFVYFAIFFFTYRAVCLLGTARRPVALRARGVRVIFIYISVSRGFAVTFVNTINRICSVIMYRLKIRSQCLTEFSTQSISNASACQRVSIN